MSKLSLEKKRKLIQILTVVGLILTVTGSVFIASSPYFKEGGGFGELLKSMGIFGPLLFLLLQISQTIYPIIPGGLHNVIGDVIYGHFGGFLLNCTGMVIGSCINFFLGKRFGSSFIKAFLSDKQYDHYIAKMNDGPGFRRLLVCPTSPSKNSSRWYCSTGRLPSSSSPSCPVRSFSGSSGPSSRRGDRMLRWLFIKLVRFYQLALSPLFPPSCRYSPTCSTYTIHAIEKHGAFKGLIMGLARISRCHPFVAGGKDPVPDYFTLRRSTLADGSPKPHPKGCCHHHH